MLGRDDQGFVSKVLAMACSLSLAPLPAYWLAVQEYGRTIPLAVLVGLESSEPPLECLTRLTSRRRAPNERPAAGSALTATRARPDRDGLQCFLERSQRAPPPLEGL